MNGLPLELESETYTDSQVAEGFRISRASFFISDIRLITNNDGQALETEVGEVGYVQFGPDGTAEIDFQNVPVGEYASLKFRVGLNAEQDATVPEDYANSNPLSQASEYWIDWGSYIFMKLEGRSDTLADNIARFDVNFTYHLGNSAEFSREVELVQPLDFSQTGHTISIDVDVATLLGLGGSSPLEIAGGNDHQNRFAEIVADNIEESFTLSR